MTGPADGIWRAFDYQRAWEPFTQRFDFRPDYYERFEPAINLPERSLVLDLAAVYRQEDPGFAAGEAAINAQALRNFVCLAGREELTALDWQHTSYRYSPSAHAVSELGHWPVPVFPNGDYYVHLSADLRWGTFGHPWQQTLTLWGDELTDSLGAELLTWLPRHAQSPA